jgi:hypothetical protein
VKSLALKAATGIHVMKKDSESMPACVCLSCVVLTFFQLTVCFVCFLSPVAAVGRCGVGEQENQQTKEARFVPNE